MKVVINVRYGGFSISELALYALAERKSLTLYPQTESGVTVYWTVPEDQRPKPPAGYWSDVPLEERAAYNDAYRTLTFSDRPEDRTDPDLIAVVEELGDKADGRCARLRVVEIPDDVEWEVAEYDGMEWVAEKHRTWS